MKKLGKGDKYSIKGSPIDMGLSSQEAHDKQTPLRGETNEMEQRPKATTKKVSSDRGTFPSKC